MSWFNDSEIKKYREIKEDIYEKWGTHVFFKKCSDVWKKFIEIMDGKWIKYNVSECAVWCNWEKIACKPDSLTRYQQLIVSKKEIVFINNPSYWMSITNPNPFLLRKTVKLLVRLLTQ